MAASELLGIGTGLLSTGIKLASGIGQQRKAKKINPIDPGYTMNQGVLNNARTLSERYGNYVLPEYNTALNNIQQNQENAFSRGIQGATSGGDVLDLATKLAYGGGQQLNELALANAQGKDQALMQSLNANAQAGQEYQNKNAYDRQQYQAQLREKAALTQARAENIYGAVDTAGSVLGSYLNPKKSLIDPTQPSPEQVAQWQQYLNMQNRGNQFGQQNLASPKGVYS